jgi:hypothetical protein
MRILIWLLFGVASAVLPLFLTAVVMFDHGRLAHWSDTWSHGELILVSMTLLLASLGDLIVYDTKFRMTKALTTFTSFFMIIISAVWYMDLFAGLLDGQVYKQEVLRHLSPVFFLSSLTVAAVCVILPKVKE